MSVVGELWCTNHFSIFPTYKLQASHQYHPWILRVYRTQFSQIWTDTSALWFNILKWIRRHLTCWTLKRSPQSPGKQDNCHHWPTQATPYCHLHDQGESNFSVSVNWYSFVKWSFVFGSCLPRRNSLRLTRIRFLVEVFDLRLRDLILISETEQRPKIRYGMYFNFPKKAKEALLTVPCHGDFHRLFFLLCHQHFGHFLPWSQ